MAFLWPTTWPATWGAPLVPLEVPPVRTLVGYAQSVILVGDSPNHTLRGVSA
jgi:hypothetical protein